MIDAVEVMYEEEAQAADEAYRWGTLRDALQQLVYELDERRSESVRESGDRNTPEYNKLESMLEQVQAYVEGRIEELTPGVYKHRCEFYHYAGKESREVLRYALQEGINAVPLMNLWPVSRRLDAAEYISKRGLASLNYERTCDAVSEYETVVLGRKKGC